MTTKDQAAVVELPLRIGGDLLGRMIEIGEPMRTICMDLARPFPHHAVSRPANPAFDVPQNRINWAVRDLAGLNMALSALGACTQTKDARKLMFEALVPERTWGTFGCFNAELVTRLELNIYRFDRPIEFDSDGASNVNVLDAIEQSRAWGLFGLACLQQFADSRNCTFLMLAAEAAVFRNAAVASNSAEVARVDENIGVTSSFAAKAESVRERGRRTQTERKKMVVDYATKLAKARASEFHNKVHAAEKIQAEVREYARGIGHPLGERMQTIEDMLKGIKFGKASNTP